MSYTATISNITDTSATLEVSTDTTISSAETLSFSVHAGGTPSGEVVYTGAVVFPSGTQAGDTVSVDISGLSPQTAYYVAESVKKFTAAFTTESTGYDVQKVATQAQWKDLANRIKAKSDVQITMTETDPGEGTPLAENHYIGVYGGDPIIMDYSTSEVNTGKKWVDGSAIYRKAYVGTYNGSSSTATRITLESSADIVMVDSGGSIEYATNGWAPVPYNEGGSEWAYIYRQATSGSLILGIKSGTTTGLRYRVWVEYTKNS